MKTPIAIKEVNLDDCWLWAGAKHPLGYGNIRVAGKTSYVHRVIYEALVCELPANISLDHLCRQPACFNPDHLEPVTHKENVLRGIGPTAVNAKKTHCKQGHKLAGDNLRITVAGGRLCRVCYKAHQHKMNKLVSEENRANGLTAKGKVPIRLYRIGART